MWGALSDERTGLSFASVTVGSNICLVMAVGPRYIVSTRTTQKTPLPTVTPLLRVTKPLPRNSCFSGFTVHYLSKYATVLSAAFTPLDSDVVWTGFIWLGMENNEGPFEPGNSLTS
jgi:hypothetical protein